MDWIIVALFAGAVLSAFAVAGGCITIYKKWDNWSASISMGILLCVPVLLYLVLVLVLIFNGGIGGTPSFGLVVFVYLFLFTIVMISIVAVGIISRRIIKTIAGKLKSRPSV